MSKDYECFEYETGLLLFTKNPLIIDQLNQNPKFAKMEEYKDTQVFASTDVVPLLKDSGLSYTFRKKLVEFSN